MLEEFFVTPRAAQTDSVVYYPLVGDEQGALPGSGSGGGGGAAEGTAEPQPRYGLQLHIANLMQAPPGAPPLPPLQHVRTADAVPQVGEHINTRGREGEGGVSCAAYAVAPLPPSSHPTFVLTC